MQIPQASIDEIVERADIVEVIGRHLQLKRRGQNYFACCPFHNEKSASFAVSTVKQIFHCFGCGESGNVINFVMKYLGLDFVAAVQSLANQYGVNLPEDRHAPSLTKEQVTAAKQHRLDLNQTMRLAVNYYRQQLANSSYASHYLQQRGLSPEVINRFELGFAPAGYHNLAKVFTDYNENQFLSAGGLVSSTEQGRRYDRFRERVLFPIKNSKGEVVGFGGRVLAKGEPKYLNSPETELFNKSKELYGLHEARESIRKSNQVIVVEGYMDVVALSQFEVSNSVATMGTAVTEEHIKTLFKLCDTICYAFDGDNAGKKAAWRALERSLSLVTDIKQVKFVFFPAEHDPDSFIREHGVSGFNQFVTERGCGLVSFLLNQLGVEVNLNSDEGKARLLSLAKPYCEQIKALALQVIFKKQLAKMVDLEPSVVESIFNNRSRFAFFNRKLKAIGSSYNEQVQRTPLDVQLLVSIVFALLNQPKLAREFPTPEISVLEVLDVEVKQLFALINFLELNYDEFSEVKITQLTDKFKFTQIDLFQIYLRVQQERANYTNVFNLDSATYCAKLRHLVYGKQRKLPPKLD